MSNSPEFRNNWDPEQILKYAGEFGAKLMNESKKARVVLRAAQEKGITVEPSGPLQKFAPEEEYEIQLMHLLSELRRVVTEIVGNADLKISAEELQRRVLELDLDS